jgi:hypothetical protein
VKIFHWLTALRVENVSRAINMTIMTHIRLVSLMLLLAIIDTAAVMTMAALLLGGQSSATFMASHHPYSGRGVYLLFVFEFTILVLCVIDHHIPFSTLHMLTLCL